MKIKTLTPRMIFDSRGYPTVEVDCLLDDGSKGRASVPSGASTGSHEALELRDNDSHFDGKGVKKALASIRDVIAKEVQDKNFSSQREFDQLLITLDGTENKSNLGANATLAASLAFAKASALSKHVPLYIYLREAYSWSKAMSVPVPLINVLNGGRHASSSTDVQEWMIVPLNSDTLGDALEKGSKVFYALREIMKKRGSSSVGDEGGFPLASATSNKEALDILVEAVNVSGLELGKDIAFALDVAASEFFKDGSYQLTCDNKALGEEEMIGWLTELSKEYPIISIEDGLSEESWDAWKKLTTDLGGTIQLVGDDLFVTNTHYIQKGGELGAGNAVLIKLNQIGTLTETVDAIELAHNLGMRAIVSHRSGETEDTTIAHLAVASGCGQIKTGSLSRSERLSKYNELLRIEEEGLPYASKIA